MAASEFHHFGVPSKTQREGETFIEGGKVHVTDPEEHPFRIEFLRFERDSPMPDIVRSRPHAAFVVEDLDAALGGKEIVIEPFDATDTVRVAFIREGEALIELMEKR